MCEHYTSSEIEIGNLKTGANRPVRIQSMLSVPTHDTSACFRQSLELIQEGCEIIRLAAPDRRSLESIKQLKKKLTAAGISVPLVADVHFNPEIALEAARIVEKVRINPGNYSYRWNHRKKLFSDTDIKTEQEYIAEKLYLLLQVCRENGTALRIGINQGSLPASVLTRFGNTPQGMTEALMEFVRICHSQGFEKLVLSLKSSRVKVMVDATRLLVEKLIGENLSYPLHLGVTESGNGIAARLKSAAGIGMLLSEGLGDTIRVSLTEPPVAEVRFARELLTAVNARLVPEAIYAAGKNFSFRLEKPVVVANPPLPSFPLPDFTLEGHNTLKSTDDKQKSLPAFIFPIQQNTTLSDIAFHRKSTELPVILSFPTIDNSDQNLARFGSLAGSAILEKLCDGLKCGDDASVGFELLQACDARTWNTEYISCPGCGRTQFRLEEALQQVKDVTCGFKGLRIAVMGCIVNGPGEMADADYGYVGAGKGKVTLYKNGIAVCKNLAETNAPEQLRRLIAQESLDVEESLK